ncbi:polysaccharide deacetylase family protein [Streptomyces bambusae]|nr:polysaccharide deacetylase family protein [Streptomyces bambusae]MCB5165908.1 polysaccharide deacetylase family protein [Streptomyces bambusae]
MTAGTLAAGALALTLAVTGCAQSVDPIERLGRKATADVTDGQDGRGGKNGNDGGGPKAARPHASPSPSAPRPGAHKAWGLDRPLEFAPKPAGRPALPAAAPGRVPVVDRIPVPAGEKTVFLTFDDGAERDPQFLKMAADLRLPISMFLTHSVAGPGYDHFGRLRDLGTGSAIQNHSLTHPNLRTLPYAAQKAEICGQQEQLQKRFGERPRLLRPPFGNYNDDTLRAAKDCGLSSVVLWRASMQINDLRYAEGDALRPGDIVLAHFRGPSELKGATLTEMTTRMLRRIQEQGYRIGVLEDYL